MKCSKCNIDLVKMCRRNEMADLDDEATDGQFADHVAASSSGDYGSWNIGVIEYTCPKCFRITQLISDNLPDYNPFIVSWHLKAKEGDYFSRFVFEYLSFIACMKNSIFFAQRSERNVIQKLKQSEEFKNRYIRFIQSDAELLKNWKKNHR